MILTYEQADRFYTLINALLGYANERFEVVRELPLPIVDLESQSKAALVAETLWDSVGIIDDFVRENPFDLPKRFLDTALAWKDALTGSFVFMGHEGGRALPGYSWNRASCWTSGPTWCAPRCCRSTI